MVGPIPGPPGRSQTDCKQIEPEGSIVETERTQDTTGQRRDGEMTALILAFFALAWFGWGSADASAELSVALSVGSSAALAVGILAAFRVCHRPRAGHALGDQAVRRRYVAVVATRIAPTALGAVLLGAGGGGAYIPVWVCAVVGLHFVALATVLSAPPLRWLGVAVTTVAAAALVVGVFTAVAPSSVTGGATGIVLLGFAIMTLAGTRTPALDRGTREHGFG
jgi:hypothetical protein